MLIVKSILATTDSSLEIALKTLSQMYEIFSIIFIGNNSNNERIYQVICKM